MAHREEPSWLDRGLRVFADVRNGEGFIALLLALNVFLILMAYYVLKPVREALVLGEGSAELKSYLSAGQVVLLAFVVPFYGKLVSRLPRMKLINTVTLFFTACPVIFYGLAKAGVPLAVIFFIWIGIFSLMIIAQFWSFATDIYTKAGRRAAVPHRRVRCVARRRVRRPDRRSAHRTDRRLRADAGGQRHPARAVGADQLHQRAPCAPRRRSAGGHVHAHGCARRSRRGPTPLRWCSGRATCS